MKNKLIYGLLAGAMLMGFNSCDNDEFLNVTHYSMLEGDQMFVSDENAIKGMTGCYDLLHRRGSYNDDPYKYWIFNGSHPTMDSQASGWDKDFMVQGWTADNSELLHYWQQSYACASRCNDFLAGLENAPNISDDVKKALTGEAMALRGFQFFGLANTFGRVPLLVTGENYVNTPEKARAKDYAEMWDFVIADFKAAAELLDWEPFQGQYGRCTKGMALTFLGDAYMWKAFTCPDQADACYDLAYKAFDQVIKSGTYELAPSFSTLYDADEVWPKEAIWQVVLNAGDQWSSWDDGQHAGARGWTGFYFGPTANGAWGTYAVSWELYDAYEVGDKRRDASLASACIPWEDLVKIGKEHWVQSFTAPQAWIDANQKHIRDGEYVMSEDGAGTVLYDVEHPIGYNPFNQEFVGWNSYHRDAADPAPTVFSTKHWRNGRGTKQWNDMWLPDHVYFKRYANVLLDQAECCFRLGKEAEGWAYVNQIRERAFGNLEVGKDLSKFLAHHNKVADFYGDNGNGDAVTLTEYPIPFNTETVTVPDAKTYYTQLKADKGFDSEVWKIAVNEERRKEFNAEPYLRSDMHKSDYLTDHIDHNYPILGLPEKGPEVIKQWQTARSFQFDINKMFMPIPQDELIKNPLCDQNEGY